MAAAAAVAVAVVEAVALDAASAKAREILGTKGVPRSAAIVAAEAILEAAVVVPVAVAEAFAAKL